MTKASHQTLDDAAADANRARAIIHRTRGQVNGAVARLISASDLGRKLKPFVFLDLFRKDGPGKMLARHPHSGIATLMYPIEGRVFYVDPDGTQGTLDAGGIEWMRAGLGMWHGGGADDGPVNGFQLWIALPPDLELTPFETHYIPSEAIEGEGPARVLLGRLGQATSRIAFAPPINYLGVRLAAGERWRYVPPKGHTILWIAVARGALAGPEPIEAGELVVFDDGEGAVTFEAASDVDFVLGSAVPHDHDLVIGEYSVHTSAGALEAGERRIKDLA